MKGNELRQAYLQFFESKGHLKLDTFSLIPENDPSLLLIGAGMAPLKPFFTFTSILLFLLCISFMGKGVVELTEAGVISGSTTIPAMNGYQNSWLNIYDRAETLIPQIMLVIASVWMLLNNYLKERKMKKEAVEESK